MSRTAISARARMLEGLLWMLAIAVGLTLLVPAAYQLHAANLEEARERQLIEQKEAELLQAEQDLEWLVNDPLTDQRILDTQGVRRRKQNASGAPIPTK